MKKHKNNPFHGMKSFDYNSGFLITNPSTEKIAEFVSMHNGKIIPRLSNQKQSKRYQLKDGRVIIDSPQVTFEIKRNKKKDTQWALYQEAERIAENLCLTKEQEKGYMFLLQDSKFRKSIEPKLIYILDAYRRIFLDKNRYFFLKFKKDNKIKFRARPLPLP